MDHNEYEALVRQGLEAARDSLARIEMHVREHGERREHMEASRLYAQFCMHVRDYLSGVHARRPLPRRFAQRVAGLRDQLAPLGEAVAELDLRPTPTQLEELVRAADDLPGTT